MARPVAGDVVLVDWRDNHLDGEPGRIRPAIVVETESLFAENYRTLLVVPLTRDPQFAVISTLVVQIEPSDENGAPERCWALCHHVTAASLTRCRRTPSRITAEQLSAIRAGIHTAIAGLQTV